MSNISFISPDEPKGALCAAVYMILDNLRRVFVINHQRNPSALMPAHRDNLIEVQQCTKQLVQTNGQYFCVSAVNRCPFEFLEWVKFCNHRFCLDYRRITVHVDEAGYVDLKGHLIEFSAFFHYRFYNVQRLIEWLTLARDFDPNCCNEDVISTVEEVKF